jgi:hypothetical protein
VTAGRAGNGSGRPRPASDGWRASLPELSIAIIMVTAISAGAYAWAGVGAMILVLSCWAILAVALLRQMPAGSGRPEASAEEWQDSSRTSIAGFWRKRGMLKDATASMASYELELRPTLQHLLAARLAERHGISLYTDPEAARELVMKGVRDGNLWHWLDPQRPPAPAQKQAGIPPRTLAAIINRLEHL